MRCQWHCNDQSCIGMWTINKQSACGPLKIYCLVNRLKLLVHPSWVRHPKEMSIQGFRTSPDRLRKLSVISLTDTDTFIKVVVPFHPQPREAPLPQTDPTLPRLVNPPHHCRCVPAAEMVQLAGLAGLGFCTNPVAASLGDAERGMIPIFERPGYHDQVTPGHAISHTRRGRDNRGASNSRTRSSSGIRKTLRSYRSTPNIKSTTRHQASVLQNPWQAERARMIDDVGFDKGRNMPHVIPADVAVRSARPMFIPSQAPSPEDDAISPRTQYVDIARMVDDQSNSQMSDRGARMFRPGEFHNSQDGVVTAYQHDSLIRSQAGYASRAEPRMLMLRTTTEPPSSRASTATMSTSAAFAEFIDPRLWDGVTDESKEAKSRNGSSVVDKGLPRNSASLAEPQVDWPLASAFRGPSGLELPWNRLNNEPFVSPTRLDKPSGTIDSIIVSSEIHEGYTDNAAKVKGEKSKASESDTPDRGRACTPNPPSDSPNTAPVLRSLRRSPERQSASRTPRTPKTPTKKVSKANLTRTPTKSQSSWPGDEKRFVNMTPDDSQKLLSAVAPSGSLAAKSPSRLKAKGAQVTMTVKQLIAAARATGTVVVDE